VIFASASASAAPRDVKHACVEASDQGQSLRDEGKLRAAVDRFVACAREECPALVRKDCAAWLADADARLPSVVFVAKDGRGRDLAEVRVSVDGALVTDRLDGRAFPIDPGDHRVRFEGAGLTIEESIVLREGEKRRVVAATLAAPASKVPVERPTVVRGPIPTATYVLGGASLVAFGAFAWFGIQGKRDADALRATCAPACDPADRDAVRTKLVIADVALGIGVASAAGAIAFALWGRSEQAPVVALSPVGGGGAAFLVGRF
jgi:hypothetical protein